MKKRLTLGMLRDWSGGKSSGTQSFLSKKVQRVIADSRLIQKGDVFLALKTASNDGHRYIDTAIEAGATACVVSSGSKYFKDSSYGVRCITSRNPLRAVQKAAAKYVSVLGIPRIGITGSNGKTTTRRFISHVLSSAFNVGETYTNWNNDIGVPLSILKLTAQEDVVVLEMGANHEREIHDLSKIVKPEFGVITNIGYAHIGFFKSLKKTTNAKFEMIDGMSSKTGLLLINGDDRRLVTKGKESPIKTHHFGLSPRCDTRATDISLSANQKLSFKVHGDSYSISTPARYFIYNALPAIFMGLEFGMPVRKIQEAVRSFKPATMRGTISTRKGVRFIVDCYNANPTSMISAFQYLADSSDKKVRRVAILGDMFELGSSSRRLHRWVGKKIPSYGVQRLITVGKFAQAIAEGARDAGLASKNISHAENSKEGSNVAKKILRAGDIVLLKGSRGVKLEEIYKSF